MYTDIEFIRFNIIL